MHKHFLALFLTLALCSCHDRDKGSTLDAASFTAGEWTFLVSFDQSTFLIQKCRPSSEINTILEKGDIQQAKAMCKDSVSAVTLENMIASIQSQLSNIESGDLINAKTNRLKAISNAILEMEKNTATLEKEQNLKAMQSEQVALKEALALAQSNAAMSSLKDIDIDATLKLIALTANSARSTAESFTEMLKSSTALYRLDPNQNRMLVRAIQAFDPLCEAGIKGGEVLEVDQGTERISYLCEGSGKLKITAVTCPLAGYERQNDFCIFTGKGLAAHSITASHNGVCAVTKANVVSCWGKPGTFPMNFVGTTRVVSGGLTRVTLPGMSGLGTPLAQMFGSEVIGSDHAICSLDSAKKLNRCWTEVANAPLNIDVFASIAGGYAHYCGITSGGTLKCWGANDYRQASPPANLANVKLLSVQINSSCAIDVLGQLSCWGSHMAQSGVFPASIPGDAFKAVAVSSGVMHTCAIRDDQTLACWGQNDYGQLSLPADLGPVRSAIASRFETCAITSDKSLRCFGRDTSSLPYKAAPPLTNVARLITGVLGRNTCAVTVEGKVSCWGSLSYNGEYSVEPPNDLGPVDDVAITAVGYICARLSAGGIQCWGNTYEVPNKIPAIFSR